MRREKRPVWFCTASRVSSCSACTVSRSETALQRRVLRLHRHIGAALTHVEIEVTVDIRDVEQPLQEVGRDIAFALEILNRRLGHGPGEVVLGHRDSSFIGSFRTIRRSPGMSRSHSRRPCSLGLLLRPLLAHGLLTLRALLALRLRLTRGGLLLALVLLDRDDLALGVEGLALLLQTRGTSTPYLDAAAPPGSAELQPNIQRF